MAEQLAVRHSDEELATTFVIGGALTTPVCQAVYEGQLGSDHFTSARERFFPNPRENVRHHEETYKRAEEIAENIYAASDSRLVVIGHSFGGIIATKLGLRRPDLIGTAKSLGGLQGGYNNTVGVNAVKRMVGSADGMEDGRRDSVYIKEFHEEIASDWSQDVDLYLDSAMFDICFPLPQGLNIELPAGQAPTRRIVGPPQLNFMMWAIRQINGMPQDVKPLTSLFTPISEHVTLPYLHAETSDTMSLRRELAARDKAANNLRQLPILTDSGLLPLAA